MAHVIAAERGRTRRKVLIAALLMLAVNALDLMSTYVASPDLSAEWNMMARRFGLGWAGLIGTKLIGSWLAVIGYAYYLRHVADCYPAPGGSDHDFARGFLFGEGPLAGSPTRVSVIRRTLVCTGYLWAGMQGLVLWVTLDNLGLAFGMVSPLRFDPDTAYHYMQALIVAGVVFARYCLGNLRRYRALQPAAVVRAAATRQPVGTAD